MTTQESAVDSTIYEDAATTLDPRGAHVATKRIEICDSTTPRQRVSFILPAYNEDANVVSVIENTALVATRYGTAYEIIVVDDGLSDRTAELVERAGRGNPCIRLVRHDANCGYREALRTGFASAQLGRVFFTDADNQCRYRRVSSALGVGGRRRRRRRVPQSASRSTAASDQRVGLENPN